MRQYSNKRDDSEKDIIKELRGRGAYVHLLNRFDLLVGWKGQWFPIEVKTGNKKLTDRQAQMILEMKNIAPFYVARNVDEAVEIVFGDK